jgi:hypothetical protein
MQPAHHMHLGNSEGKRISHHANNFVDRVFKSVCVALFGSESTELAR